jgi:hypothetical protein
MSAEDPTLIVGVITLVVAVLTLLAAVLYGEIQRRAQRRQQKLAEEQLALARGEAKRHPILVVTEVQLLDASEEEVVQETRLQRENWLKQLQQYEEDKKQWENERDRIQNERARDPLSHPPQELLAPGPVDPRHSGIGDVLRHAQKTYERDFPDKVLSVTLSNQGRVAALDLSGQLYLEAHHLRPLKFPGLDGVVETNHREGVHKVEVYTEEGSQLLPAPTEEEHTFRVAVMVESPGSTSVRYTFATPQGDTKEGTWPLEIPSR